MGYFQAGFEVVGVDNVSQPNYPFEFYRSDAIEFLQRFYEKFDLIHASPPCQLFSRLRGMHPNREYPNLLNPVRDLLLKTKKPYVIENVVGSPLNNPVLLCGSQFGLKTYRHRLFECYPFILAPAHFPHYDRTPRGGYNNPSPKGFYTIVGNQFSLEVGGKCLQIDWMTTRELSQAVPPAYTEWIGRQMVRVLGL